MKVLCKHCLNSCKKSGLIDCKKYKTHDIEALRKERKTITTPERLEELNKILDYFDYGRI